MSQKQQLEVNTNLIGSFISKCINQLTVSNLQLTVSEVQNDSLSYGYSDIRIC
jgi:hypothetical protein